MKKISVDGNFGSLLSGQDVQVYDQPLAENLKRNIEADKFYKAVSKKKKIMVKEAGRDDIGGTPVDGSYSGIVDGYRDNKSYQEEGFTGNFERNKDVYKKLRKKRRDR